jgi:oxygen-independent coproporphyrinogen III oxidase
MIGEGSARDVSLYVHVPFCTKKCPYCHFFVLPNEERFKRPFLPALLKELALRLPELQGKRLVSLYFGGGTPTKLSPDAYALFLNALRDSKVEIAPGCEITLEANPEDVTSSLMSQFRVLGINRISLGVQSLVDQDLVLLGRTHLASRALQAIQEVYEAGIVNISIDLMFELPHQTLSRWERCLEQVSKLPITHLSLYNLTFEPHTVFFKQRAQLTSYLPPDEERLVMLQTAITFFESCGLQRYEISAFAKPGMHSRHNTGYWTGRPFLGLGPSAFSYWEGVRFSNPSHFHQYIDSLNQNRLPTDFEEKLDPEKALRELLAICLRLVEGVDLSQFAQQHGPLPHALCAQLQALIEKGWLERSSGALRLTSSGQLFYDSVATELI